MGPQETGKGIINLDYGAAAPLDPDVVAAMLPYLTEHYGNPSSGHSLAEEPRRALAEARQAVAGLIGAPPERLVFAASGSEANNLAIKGVAARTPGGHIVTSAIEHYSVLNPIRTLQKLGYEATFLPVDQQGRVDPATLADAIRPDTILVSIAAANPEIGTIQDLAALAGVAARRKVPFHTDGVAAAGWIPLAVREMGIGLCSVAGDQFYGPKGTGALYVAPGIPLAPLVEGGIQERGLRAGTENVPALVGMGAAARKAAADRSGRAARVAGIRDALREALFAGIPYLHLNGHPTDRLPHNLHVSVEFVEGEALFMHLDMAGILVSSGSSCASQALKSSQVLAGIGVGPELAQGSLQFTLGRDSDPGDVPRVAEELRRIAALLRQMSPLYRDYLRKGGSDATIQ